VTIDGHGKPGELVISLGRNMGAPRVEVEFSRTVKYGLSKDRYQILWSEFTSVKHPGKSAMGFDGLRIEGSRDDGSSITIANIAFF